MKNNIHEKNKLKKFEAKKMQIEIVYANKDKSMEECILNILKIKNISNK